MSICSETWLVGGGEAVILVLMISFNYISSPDRLQHPQQPQLTLSGPAPARHWYWKCTNIWHMKEF